MIKIEEEQEQTQEPENQEESPQDLIEKANLAAERLEKGNKELERLLIQQQQQKIENTLGGTSTAGTPKKTQEQKEKEQLKKILAGTGFEDDFPYEKV